jgi:hypothetical protein
VPKNFASEILDVTELERFRIPPTHQGSACDEDDHTEHSDPEERPNPSGFAGAKREQEHCRSERRDAEFEADRQGSETGRSRWHSAHPTEWVSR